MKVFVRPLAAVAACILGVSAVATPQGRAAVHHVLSAAGVKTEAPPVRPGDRMRTLSLLATDGSARTFDAQSLSGTTVFNVFTSWCPSCRAEAPMFARAAAILGSQGIRFVGIDQAEPADVVTRLAAQERLPFPVLLDQRAESKSVLGARMIPTTVVVKDGLVTGVAYGPISQEQLMALVAAR